MADVILPLTRSDTLGVTDRPVGMRFPYRAVARIAPGLWLATQEGGEYVLWVDEAEGATSRPAPAILPVTALQAGYLLARAESSRPGSPA